jgi:hypothetical protein
VIDEWRASVCVGVYKGFKGQVNGEKNRVRWGKVFWIFG